MEPFRDETEFPYFAELAFNEAVMNMNMGRVFTKEEAEGYYAGIVEYNRANSDSGAYKTFLRNGGSYIGVCSLWVKGDTAEVEYMVLPEYWGKGYAAEMVARLVEIAKQDTAVTKVSGLVDPKNIASKTVLTKNGFVHEKNLDVEEDHSTVEVLSLAICARENKRTGDRNTCV